MRETGIEFFDCGVYVFEARGQGVVVFELELCETSCEIGEAGGVDVVGCDSGVEGLHAAETFAR